VNAWKSKECYKSFQKINYSVLHDSMGFQGRAEVVARTGEVRWSRGRNERYRIPSKEGDCYCAHKTLAPASYVKWDKGRDMEMSLRQDIKSWLLLNFHPHFL
jgi:hypothetical protein